MMGNPFRIQLEKIVLELQQNALQAEFEAQVASVAKNYYITSAARARAVADVYQDVYESVKILYEGAVKEDGRD